jgi:acetyl esterase/lipase
MARTSWALWLSACLGLVCVLSVCFAIRAGNVDQKNVFVVGVSGGAYAALGSFMRTELDINAFIAWVPITDLTAWYHQSSIKGSEYGPEIIKCTSKQATLDQGAMQKRSPLSWAPNAATFRSKLEIYAGLNDGYDGSVPVSHSILFYNKIAALRGAPSDMISESDAIKILSRDVVSSDREIIEDRAVYFSKGSNGVSIVIFGGGHEMLPKYTMQRLKALLYQ